MIQHIGYGTFIFFAAFSFLSGIWAWFIAPETKCVIGVEKVRPTGGGLAATDPSQGTNA
jgi:hypothetical protein